MRFGIAAASLVMMLAGVASAKDTKLKHARGDSMSLGFEVSETAGDFGLGFQLTSPIFASVMAVRAAGGISFYDFGVGKLDPIDDEPRHVTYAPYYTVRLGILTSAGWPTKNIRGYAEGGALAVLPNSEFTDESLVMGGYGTIGFEFFLHPDSGWIYYIEGTGVGTGATADKIAGDPIYQNGFRAAVGVRYNL